MIKYFCDKCGSEIKTSISMTIPMYAYDGLGNVIIYVKDNHLCEECAEKFKMIQDQLEHDEDFFND